MSDEKVLVTGATGFLGRHLVQSVHRHGYYVVAAARSCSSDLAPDEWVLGDISRPEIQRKALNGCAFVINAAGVVARAEKGDGIRHLMHEINCRMPEALANAAAIAGVRRFIHISSTGVYGAVEDLRCDETTRCFPADDYEQSKYAGEVRLRALRNSEMKIIIARPSNVFGENHPWNKLLTWMKAVKRGKVVLAKGAAMATVNHIYIQDVCDAAIAVFRSPDVVGGEVLNINTPMSVLGFYEATARAVGARLGVREVPRIVLYAAATVCDLLVHVMRQTLPLTREKVNEVTSRRVYLSNRISQICPGFPLVGLDEGLARLARHYEDLKLL